MPSATQEGRRVFAGDRAGTTNHLASLRSMLSLATGGAKQTGDARRNGR